MEGQDVPVQLPTIQAVLGSVGRYQDHTTSRGDPAGGGTAYDHLHRRYPRHGGDRVSPERPHYSSGVSAGEPGVCGQPPQVRTDPHSGNRIPGVHCQLHQDGAQTTGGKDQEDQVIEGLKNMMMT